MKPIILRYGDILNNLGTYYIMEAPKTKNNNRRIRARCGRCGCFFEGFLSNIRKNNAGCFNCRIFPDKTIFYKKGEILNDKTNSQYICEVPRGQYSHRRAIVKCGHCGHFYEACIENVKNGSLCPYCKPSNNSRCVENIQNILDKLQIEYQREYTFSDLRADNNLNTLRFDFAIFIKNKILLLEVDGQQHYKPVDFFGGEKSFVQLQKNDNKKNNYVKDRENIFLVRIPYFSFREVDEFYIKNILRKYDKA